MNRDKAIDWLKNRLAYIDCVACDNCYEDRHWCEKCENDTYWTISDKEATEIVDAINNILKYGKPQR